MYVCESLIYAIWSCEALGSLQMDVAPPQISLCPLLIMTHHAKKQPVVTGNVNGKFLAEH